MSDKIDTPRTDAEREWGEWETAEGWEGVEYVRADFARTLERELSAALEEQERAERAERERDEARADAERYRWLKKHSWAGNGAYYFKAQIYSYHFNPAGV